MPAGREPDGEPARRTAENIALRGYGDLVTR
ncbi:hypothetical protein HD597_002852 [Nonomuraea thailandensis]|uniref:Uncharacterized protein n=1 Tax=Nonomuraea thailandensis TaxID=1188745 RepID=A0A9X2GBC3_9ACTN|nr:hypothetical protein [Nonomuraea thailandensis]